jgi:hypothetical protein
MIRYGLVLLVALELLSHILENNIVIGTAELLTFFEQCPRKAFWARQWKQRKLLPVQMLEAGIKAAMLEKTRTDWGNVAGETIMGLGVEPGIQSDLPNTYDQVIHLSTLSDILSTAIRKPSEPAWQLPEPLPNWQPSCFISPDGKFLRRIVCVTSWSNSRHYDVCRSWATLGPVCHYDLPMQIAVAVLGTYRDGKYHSYWTNGLLHPNNKQLRFRKKYDVHEPFKETWDRVWRENRDEISTALWLQNMLKDGVLPDLCFSIKIDVLEKKARQRVLSIAAQRVLTIDKIKTLPDEQYTACSWPMPCTFLHPCHHGEAPSANWNFVKTEGKI